MDIFKPIQITDATLTAHNVPENDDTEWSAVTAYVIGNTVMVSTVEPNIHRLYEALQNNTNVEPWLDTAGTTWLDLGPTNRWGALDESTGTVTSVASPLDFTVTPGEIYNAIALLNIDASTAQIIIDDPGAGEVYNKTFTLISDSGIDDWYDYYFAPIESQTDLVLTDLPAYQDASVQVILTTPSGTVSLGVFALGFTFNVGITLHGTGVGIIDYSKKETDAFGGFQILKRAFSDRSDYAIMIDTDRVNYVKNYLTSIRATPAIFIGATNRPSTVVYGYWRDFDIILSNWKTSDCSLRVEGLV